MLLKLFKKKDNTFQQDFEEELKKHEIERKKIIKESKRKLSKLEKAEFILDYTHSFSSNYMQYNGLTEWIKNMNFKDRMWYIINSCNESSPTIQEIFLLALAYNNLGTLYNEYAIYYIELYLKENKFYNKDFRGCNNQNDIINYQWCLFNFILANKYKEDLNFEKALKHALAAKGINDNLVKPYFTLFSKQFDEYSLISELLYKQGNINAAIENLNEGICKTKNTHLKKKYIEQLKLYKEYKNNNKNYIPKKTKKLRIDMKTKQTYNLTTGEIIK